MVGCKISLSLIQIKIQCFESLRCFILFQEHGFLILMYNNLSTAIVLISQIFCIIIIALQESVFYLINVFESHNSVSLSLYIANGAKWGKMFFLQRSFSGFIVQCPCLPMGGSIVHESFAVDYVTRLWDAYSCIFLISRYQDNDLIHS